MTCAPDTLVDFHTGRDLRKHEVGVGRREPRREVWRLRHQLRPLRAVDAALDAVARLAAEVRVVPEYSFEGLVRAVALGRREALVDRLHQAQCLQRSRQPVVR